ncbi:helix-turn-helix transcriptional regulator [[Actinomadura] parvosata]|uniref:helix-turn-helix transcriptional regulator n=1 Tax=[Actinomadura] parvosata TaxID=1955412 RepID=UPI00406C1316
MTSEETFAEEVRRRRTALGLTQERLADLADVSRGTVRNIEGAVLDSTRSTRTAIRAALAGAESRTGAPQTPAATAGEVIARRLDAIAEAFPDDMFPDSEVVFHAVRRAYQHAARIARGEA